MNVIHVHRHIITFFILTTVVLSCSGEGIVYQVDEATGGLEVTHKLALSSRDYAGDPGPVGVFL